MFANKFDAEGNIVRRKVRLVAKGYSQILGEDYKETYAAVVRRESHCMSAAAATQSNLCVWQVDFVSAYLNSIPKYDVYMDVPPDLRVLTALIVSGWKVFRAGRIAAPVAVANTSFPTLFVSNTAGTRHLDLS